MTFLKPKITPDMPLLCIQKEIQMILEERGLWPSLGLRLNCEKQKCFSCKAMTNYKLCIKEKCCKSCIKLKEYCDKSDKFCICDECVCHKKRCQCV